MRVQARLRIALSGFMLALALSAVSLPAATVPELGPPDRTFAAGPIASFHDKDYNGDLIADDLQGMAFRFNFTTPSAFRRPGYLIFETGGLYTGASLVLAGNRLVFLAGGNASSPDGSGVLRVVSRPLKPGSRYEVVFCLRLDADQRSGSVRYRIANPSDGQGSWYVRGNFVHGYPDVTANNWAGGMQGDYWKQVRASSPHPYILTGEQEPQAAYEAVLARAGASFPRRDTQDARIVAETSTGTASHGGKYGGPGSGFVDSQKEVGGWPRLRSLPPPQDSDHDGMPDSWEVAAGLNPLAAQDRNGDSDGDGYTNLEEYLNSLVKHHFSDTDSFRRGDANADGELNIGDAIFILRHLFASGSAPTCLDAANGNGDGHVDISDAIAILIHLFGAKRVLPDPVEKCGVGATTDTLGCAEYPIPSIGDGFGYGIGYGSL